MEKSSTLRAPLKRARGHGSAHSGTHHFWVQRLSAVALLPLSAWFVVTTVTHIFNGDRATVIAWLKNPLVALAVGLLVVMLFVHARLGIQTIIEDYVQNTTKKMLARLLLDGLTIILGAASLMAVIKLHFFTM